MSLTVTVLVTLLVCSSCAHSFVDNYEPTVDTKGVDLNATRRLSTGRD